MRSPYKVLTNWHRMLIANVFPLVQVLKLRPTLWSFILQSESTDLEHFSDVVEETEKLVVCGDVSEDEQSAGGGHGNKEGHQTCSGHGNKEGGESSYIIDHRNPLHCGAESTCLWELERVRPHLVPPRRVLLYTHMCQMLSECGIRWLFVLYYYQFRRNECCV